MTDLNWPYFLQNILVAFALWRAAIAFGIDKMPKATQPVVILSVASPILIFLPDLLRYHLAIFGAAAILHLLLASFRSVPTKPAESASVGPCRDA